MAINEWADQTPSPRSWVGCVSGGMDRNMKVSEKQVITIRNAFTRSMRESGQFLSLSFL